MTTKKEILERIRARRYIKGETPSLDTCGPWEINPKALAEVLAELQEGIDRLDWLEELEDAYLGKIAKERAELSEGRESKVEECYECMPEIFGEYRPWMANKLCKTHKEKAEKRTEEIAKEMANNPIRNNAGAEGSTTITKSNKAPDSLEEEFKKEFVIKDMMGFDKLSHIRVIKKGLGDTYAGSDEQIITDLLSFIREKVKEAREEERNIIWAQVDKTARKMKKGEIGLEINEIAEILQDTSDIEK